MTTIETREIGSTGLRATTLGIGGAPLGNNVPDTEEDVAIAAVQLAYEAGIRYFDMAPIYGLGRAERRIGRALAGIPRDEFVISTKVGRLLEPPGSGLKSGEPEIVFDWSRDGVMRSLDESLQRLGMDRVDIALLHGPQDHYETAIGAAYPALEELRSQGVITAIGAGMNEWEMPAQFAREADFDCFLVAGRYTLLDQSALAEFLPLCQEKGISVILGGPYNSGILASDLSADATYQYAKAPPEYSRPGAPDQSLYATSTASHSTLPRCSSGSHTRPSPRRYPACAALQRSRITWEQKRTRSPMLCGKT